LYIIQFNGEIIPVVYVILEPAVTIDFRIGIIEVPGIEEIIPGI
jgi:hypothetical protein